MIIKNLFVVYQRDVDFFGYKAYMYKWDKVILQGFRMLKLYLVNLMRNIVNGFSNMQSNEFYIFYILFILVRILIKNNLHKW